MGTALSRPMFGDLAQQLVALAGNTLGASASTAKVATGLAARVDATAGRAGASDDATRARAVEYLNALSYPPSGRDSAATSRARGNALVAAPPAPGSPPNSPRRAALAQRAQDYLEANLDQPFSLHELSEMARCSERMLQYAFRDVYGMGPQAWFQAMKLKEAYRELSTSESRSVRVSDVALRWGFTHFGRFSVEYRRMFGESPSETLKRGSQSAGMREKPVLEKRYRAGEVRERRCA